MIRRISVRPASGRVVRTVAIRTTDVLTVRGGLIVDVWVIADEVDLLRQLGQVAPNANTAEAARLAADELFRGVVAASSAVSSERVTGLANA